MRIYSISYVISIKIYTYYTPRYSQSTKQWHIFIWDIQTGVGIGDISASASGKISFHGDQGTFTLVGVDTFYTYNGLKCVGRRWTKPLPSSHQQSACWVHGNSLRFATSFETNGKHVINIQGFRQATGPHPVVVGTFPVPSQDGMFSFSPTSFHASFVTKKGITILDVQDSKILLSTQVAQQLCLQPGHFSPNGCFFACKTLESGISIWRNAPAGYTLWGTLQPRLPFNEFSFSPTVVSILAWGPRGIQLLDLENSTSTPSPNENKPLHRYRNHLVACSADERHIVTVQQEGSVVTVFGPLMGAPLLSIDTDMQIQDIRIIDNTVFAVDRHKLVRWHLGAEWIMHSTPSADRAAVVKTLDINHELGTIQHLTLSNDCSQVAFARYNIFLYNVGSQEVDECAIGSGKIMNIQFSPDGNQLWVVVDRIGELWRPLCPSAAYDLVRLRIVEKHFGGWDEEALEDKFTQVTLQAFHKCHIGSESKWVESAGGRKLLWLPPSWRVKDEYKVKWEGNFLALVDGSHPEPVIIKLQL